MVKIAYVVLVAALAILGFALGSPWPIVAAAVLTLPASVLAVPAAYVVIGLLGLVPGANPSSSSGSGSSTGPTVTSGDAATWFTLVSDVVIVGALVAAALLTVALLSLLARRRVRPVPLDRSA